jgi:hypothetical protein
MFRSYIEYGIDKKIPSLNLKGLKAIIDNFQKIIDKNIAD